MKLTSPAFMAGESIPKRHTGEGEDASPPLSWSEVPEGVESFTLIMDDPDAPGGSWVHWVVYDLPGQARGLAEGRPKTQTLPEGAKQGACWGVDCFERLGYHGPFPPPGPAHRYSFRLYALSSRLGLPPRCAKEQVLGAMKGRVLAEASLEGRYRRR